MTIVPWRHANRYGMEESYVHGMAWLDDCGEVEDWGCALAHAKRYCKGRYRGVDGTAGKADEVVDLSTYRSTTEGLFMRHVLEHNRDWRVILGNALASFTRKMTLVRFRPLADEDVFHVKQGQPVDIDLCRADFEALIAPFVVKSESIHRRGSKVDTIHYLQK